LSAGYQLCQSIHSSIDFVFKFPFLSYIWHKRSNYIASLSVKDEPSLLNLVNTLKAKNIRFSEFREPDIENQLTAITIEPSKESHRICQGLPLSLKEFSSNGINKHQFKKIKT